MAETTETTNQPVPNAEAKVFALEYVSAPTGWARTRPAVMPTHGDDVRELPHETIELMRCDPVVESNHKLLTELVLADGVQLSAKLDESQEEDAPDNKLAAEIATFCIRNVEDYLQSDLREVCEGLLEAIPYGNRTAEQTFEPVFTGQDANRLTLKTIKLKSHGSINFVVDDYWNILGIQPTYARNGEKPPVLPRRKFVILSYNKRNEDPRGRSGWRSFLNAWMNKIEAWPILQRFLKQCAIPGLIGEVSPNSKPETVRDASGAVVYEGGKAKVMNPIDQMLAALAGYENSTVIAVAAGSKVTQIQNENNGELFRFVFDLLNREITQGQLRSTRATTEAQHGSKADSQTSLDLLTTFVWYLKGRLANVLRDDVLKTLVFLNFGPDAERFTPDVMLGDADRYDWAKDATAIAALAAILTDSQLDELCVASGIPAPLPEEERPRRGVQPANDEKDSTDKPTNGGPNGDAKPKANSEPMYTARMVRDVFKRQSVFKRSPVQLRARDGRAAKLSQQVLAPAD